MNFKSLKTNLILKVNDDMVLEQFNKYPDFYEKQEVGTDTVDKVGVAKVGKSVVK